MMQYPFRQNIFLYNYYTNSHEVISRRRTSKNVLGGVMHIPDNYLSPSTCAAAALAVTPIWIASVKKIKEELPKEKITLLGIGAAFSFLFMMFNVPLPGGTTGHAVGGTLIAILLGPWAACLSVSVALLIQALLFGDGGVLAFGANCFNVAVVCPFAGYFIYKFITDHLHGERGQVVGAALGSYIGINIAALFAAVEFGIQPLFFHGADGLPLYCPYPLSVSIPAMLLPHLLVAGVVELLFTVSVFAFIKKVSPGILRNESETRTGFLYGVIVFLICLTPLGLLAAGTAWGEWGTGEIALTSAAGLNPLGYVPEGMNNGFSFKTFFPDYSVPGLGEVSGYILSAVAGSAILIILFRVLLSQMKLRNGN